MNTRTRYRLIASLLILLVLGYEFFLDSQAKQNDIESGKTIKSNTHTQLLPSSTTGEVVHHQFYSLSYSESNEQAEWVAYELKKEQLSSNRFKRPHFEIDNQVRTGAAHWKNYKKSGYDRGHLCPAGDRRFSKAAYHETFLTSNISPQNHDFNSGIWNRLEQKVRHWAKVYNGVFVITGGVLTTNLKKIGKEHVTVPKLFYKIVLDNTHTKNIKVIAFLLPNKPSSEPLQNFVVSVDSLETLTGIDFFEKLDDSLQTRLEAEHDYNSWRD